MLTKVDEKLITKYLLGDISQQDRELVEASLFDSETINLIEQIEGELIDDFVFGRLHQSDRELFLKNFCVYPHRIERLKVAQTLSKFAQQSNRRNVETIPDNAVISTSKSPILAWAFASIFGIICLVLIPLLVSVWKQSNELNSELEISKQREEELQRREEELQKRLDEELSNSHRNQEEIAKLQDKLSEQMLKNQNLKQSFEQSMKKKPESIIAMLLPSGFRDSGKTNRITIDKSIKQIHLVLSVKKDPDYVAYRIRVSDDYGKTFFLGENNFKLIQSDNQVMFTVSFPARRLEKGDYLLIVQGMKENSFFGDIENYLLRVKQE